MKKIGYWQNKNGIILDKMVVYIVIDKGARGGEAIDSVWASAKKARARKEEIRAYRIEKYEINE